jgi:hypothetical protein
MESRLQQRKRLLQKLDAEYQAFLADLIRERAAMAETVRLREERKARDRTRKRRQASVAAAEAA